MKRVLGRYEGEACGILRERERGGEGIRILRALVVGGLECAQDEWEMAFTRVMRDRA